MATNDPGLAPVGAIAEDPAKGAVDVPADDAPVAPDQFDPKYETTRWEIWAYYRWVTLSSVIGYCLPNNGEATMSEIMASRCSTSAQQPSRT